MTFFSYFTDSSEKRNFRKLWDTIKNDLFKSECRWFQLFSLIFRYFIFYPESSLILLRVSEWLLCNANGMMMRSALF